MPQASDELRKLMIDRFGDIGDEGPVKYLTTAGYSLTGGWLWTPKPGVTCLKDMTRDEFDCLLFLVHEWDFGSLVETADEVRDEAAEIKRAARRRPRSQADVD